MIAAAKALAKIANVDLEAYGLEMLKAGTNLASKTEEELITADAKSFDMGGVGRSVFYGKQHPVNQLCQPLILFQKPFRPFP